MEKTCFKFLVFSILIIAGLAVSPIVSHAASIYFSPSSGAHTVGSAFAAAVYVSSTDQAINAVSGVISFPSDKLEVVSLSKSGSVLTLWVQEPSFSNSAGTVNFEGIVLNPGFIGARGKIITVNFRAKRAGAAALNFSSGSVLANDGQGTSLLVNLGSANFNLRDPAPRAPEVRPPVEITGVPSAPKISSPTHPDLNKWYAANNPKLTWSLPPDATAVRLLVGRIPRVIPTVHYEPAISSRELSDLADGVWYFHVRLRNRAGWGDVAHFRFQIDTEKPSRFEISQVEREDKTDPKVKFVFDAEDETSGIDYYEVRINDESPQVWRDDGSGIFKLPALGPGGHTLIARAFDKAGNSLANFAEFTIEPLRAPIITDYPGKLASGEMLIVRGATYPNSRVILWLQRENDEAKSQVAESGRGGNFIFVVEEELKDGAYKLWAEVVDQRGARSQTTEKLTMVVERPAILELGSWAVNLLAVVVPIIALIFLLVYLLWYWWCKFMALRRRARKEVREAEEALHTAFDLLKKSIREQIEMLKKTKTKRQSTEEEDRVIRQLERDLSNAKKFVKKEIKDIEREVE